MTGQEPFAVAFTDPEEVARYAKRPQRQVPGFLDLQKMACQLLAERVPADGKVLVLGAGGGLELKVFAEAQPNWQFCGVDPSTQMLELARRTLGPLATRVSLYEGYIDSAPAGPFDGATCLLTMHFLDRGERREALAELHRRLAPGAPLIVAHHCAVQGQALEWLSRSAAFAAMLDTSPEQVHASATIMAERLLLLKPEEEEALLRDAGFVDPALFYAGLSFRGWVCNSG